MHDGPLHGPPKTPYLGEDGRRFKKSRDEEME